MQALHIRLKPDRVLIRACMSVHGLVGIAIAMTYWPLFLHVPIYLLLLFSCFNMWRRQCLERAHSIVLLYPKTQDWCLVYRSGEKTTVKLQASILTGSWVWLQFRDNIFKSSLVLLTPSGTDAQSLRRLRVMLRG